MIFACAECGTPITRDVSRLDDLGRLSDAEGADRVPEGSFLVGDDERPWSEGRIILNPRDLVNTRRHPDSRRSQGCCGPDGLDGVNTVCAQGHEIGTRCSDCWEPHDVHLEPGRVVAVGDSGTAG